ncbi:MAG: ECF transporter S component [Lachnospiraceae bacterium]|nr:ECF transporter S component [Lachnospiraceae bacterium]
MIQKKINTKTLALAAVFTALTYVFTAFINIRLPITANGGLIHLGNIPLFIGAITFGSSVGAISGGIGMALFDLLSGWTVWAPFTLVIVALMGYTMGKIMGRSYSMSRIIIAIISAGIIKIAGYYIAEVILYGNFATPLTSIPGNILQISAAAVIVIPIAPLLKKAATGILYTT